MAVEPTSDVGASIHHQRTMVSRDSRAALDRQDEWHINRGTEKPDVLRPIERAAMNHQAEAAAEAASPTGAQQIAHQGLIADWMEQVISGDDDTRHRLMGELRAALETRADRGAQWNEVWRS